MDKRLYRNDSKKELVSNGSRRNGQFEWHNENCQVEIYDISYFQGEYSRPIWCATHGQWASESPVKKQFIFEDGTVMERKI